VFDEKGEPFNSPSFASWMEKHIEDNRQIVFVIGGAYGLDERALERADATISLGGMVWTRNLARHMVLEQIYRALEIAGGGNFHKE